MNQGIALTIDVYLNLGAVAKSGIHTRGKLEKSWYGCTLILKDISYEVPALVMHSVEVATVPQLVHRNHSLVIEAVNQKPIKVQKWYDSKSSLKHSTMPWAFYPPREISNFRSDDTCSGIDMNRELKFMKPSNERAYVIPQVQPSNL